MAINKKKYPSEMNEKELGEWVASPEGQKSIRESIQSAMELTAKLKKQRTPLCDCCYCRNHRRLIG